MVGRRVLVGFGAVIATIGAFLLATTEGAETGPVVEIDVLDATVVDGKLAAAVSIANNDNRQQDVEVSLTLGLFGDDEPWARRVVEIGAQEAAIRSGDTTLVVFDESVTVADGSYEFTAWVSTEPPNDGVTHATATFAVDVVDGSHGRVRALETGAPRIASPDLGLTSGDHLGVAGDIEVHDASGDTSLKLDFIPADTAAPWWAATAVRSSVFEEPDDSDGVLSFSVDHLVMLSPGDYRVRVELLDDGEWVDAIVLADVLTMELAGDHLVRNAPPSGPLAIADAQLSQPEADELLVEVEIVNLSGAPLDGLFWWLLSTPGEPEPWNYADATSFRVGRRLEPGERRTIRLATDGTIAAGTGFEVSVWAHTTTPDSDDTTHSDGVRLTQLINTTPQQQGE